MILLKSLLLIPRATLLLTEVTSEQLSDLKKPWFTRSRKILRKVYLVILADIADCDLLISYCHFLYL